MFIYISYQELSNKRNKIEKHEKNVKYFFFRIVDAVGPAVKEK